MARINYSAMTDEYLVIFGQFISALKNIERVNDEFKARARELEDKRAKCLSDRDKALAVNPENRDAIIAKYDISEIIKAQDALKTEKKLALSPYNAMRDGAIVAILANDSEREEFEKTGKLGELSLSKAYKLSCDKGDSIEATGTYEVVKGEKKTVVEVKDSLCAQLKKLYERLGMTCDNTQALNKSVRGLASMCGGMRRAKVDDGFLKAKNARVFNEDLVRALCRQMITMNGAFSVSEENGVVTVSRVEF